MSFFGNDTSNAEIRREYWKHGLTYGSLTTLVSLGGHFLLKRYNKWYGSWSTPRYAYVLGSIFIGATAFFAESKEIELAKKANEQRLLDEKIRRELELMKRFEQQNSSAATAAAAAKFGAPKVDNLTK